MARPPIDDLDRRTVWIKYRASPTEAARIELRRAKAGLSLSAYNRSLALEGAIIQREPLADQELVRALAAIGNNLNQIARTANISGEVDPMTSDRLRGSLDQLEGVIESIIG